MNKTKGRLGGKAEASGDGVGGEAGEVEGRQRGSGGL